MYRRLLTISTLALTLGLSAPAWADRDRDERRGTHSSHQDRNARHDERRHSSHRHDDRRHEQRHRDRRDHRRDDARDGRRHTRTHWHQVRDYRWEGPRYRVVRYQPPPGYVRHYWAPGHRVPPAYRHTRYVVRDYRNYRLYDPPRGHHWVRVDHDVVLTAVATGVIAAVVHGIFM